ncbi:MAG TPA: hypothetical protein VEH84_17570 [Alphaproteobacteria bacterium]|nr:hypothetical protein [Alphaproteobacteria bacterium]
MTARPLPLAALAALALLPAAAAASGGPALDLPRLAGAAPEAVAAALGAPRDCRPGREKTEICRYDRHGAEIVFVGRRAEWLAFDAVEAPFGPEALAALGLPAAEPVFRNPFLIRWHDLGGMLDVSLHGRGGRLERVAATARRPPVGGTGG